MKKYNHAVDLAFEIISNTADGSDITWSMLREALLEKIADMDQSQTWEECCLPVWDTYEMESDQ